MKLDRGVFWAAGAMFIVVTEKVLTVKLFYILLYFNKKKFSFLSWISARGFLHLVDLLLFLNLMF